LRYSGLKKWIRTLCRDVIRMLHINRAKCNLENPENKRTYFKWIILVCM
jgi:hypothetical protein